MSGERLRLFVALTLDPSARREIIRLQNNMWGNHTKGLTAPENLHLTLAFLGETESGRLDDIVWAMDKVRMQPPELRFDRIGVFRNVAGDIWWLGVKENKTLEELQYRLADNLKNKGFRLEDRTFIPHLTLSRRVRPSCVPKHGRLERPICSRASHVSLMRSDHINGKRVYSELYRSF